MKESEECPHQCQCACHKHAGNVMHITACCRKCSICDKNISFDKMEEHLNECHQKHNFAIDKNLIDALNQDKTWKPAYNVAKRIFDNLPLLIEDAKTPNSYKPVSDFLAKCNSKCKDDFSGRISIREIFDSPAILLEVKFERSPKEKKILEIAFDKIGLMLHAAIM